MSRGLVEDAVSPIPLGSLLPSIYRELDPNSMLMTEAMDVVMASIFLSLDNLSWYFDPMLSPLDFLTMLADWVGVTIDENWREDQKRRLVVRAVELYTWRGTKEGLTNLVEAYTGVVPEIEESGGVVYAVEGGAQLPGSPRPGVRVRVQLPPGGEENLARLTRIIADAVPAHVAVNVEISRSEPSDKTQSDGSVSSPAGPGELFNGEPDDQTRLPDAGSSPKADDEGPK